MHFVPSPAAPPDLETLRPPCGELRSDRRVPRETVHKSATAEVLLTDAKHLGGDRFAVAARWHRDHFIGPLDGRSFDPVLLAETARQAAIHVSHRFLGIPFEQPFVLGEIAAQLDGALPPLRDAVLDVRCRRTAGHPRRACLELNARVWAEGRPVGRARVRWEAMEPRRYAVLRKRGAAQPPAGAGAADADAVPLPPARAGLRLDRDVLVAADAGRPDRWWLRLDPGHPVLFDHPSDHIPGMALVEAFRQASGAAAVAGGTIRPESVRDVAALAVEFTSFGEHDLPVAVSAESAEAHEGAAAFQLAATQGDRALARARVRWAAPERTGCRTGAAC
ncbi:ScbA/BarX family gamma-butyrolactone biosynthesis protein [Streptomyces sp. S.PNR 29]|uniref:ScbA/BarX family gamma-butyrolactone biosynthesis protein n=1 Tax=Streptomyces sp. S.PNR 29 TaxID=2973805 RepID=UPI0025AED78E|nr:ScbA/BarX family gamma-butyrolactone biosynthesis protein [Streptomyces sp. S.PNR 29]MDN0193474.1 lactone biosynthesis protein, mmfl [Streptomyces sp. S.PNR 29]